jgi:hypothetical protein
MNGHKSNIFHHRKIHKMSKENKATSHTPLIDHHYKTYHHRQVKATVKYKIICWGPSASEGPQKHDLTMFL